MGTDDHPGGAEIGSHTLTRFFSFHALILAAVTAALIAMHLALVIRQGISNPPGFRREPYLAGLAAIWLTYNGANQGSVNVADRQNGVPVSVKLSTKAVSSWRVFYANGCINCHQVGTLGGQVGPNLTNIGARRDRAYLYRWVRNPQAIKPGTVMPAFPQIPSAQYDDLITFLTELK